MHAYLFAHQAFQATGLNFGMGEGFHAEIDIANIRASFSPCRVEGNTPDEMGTGEVVCTHGPWADKTETWQECNTWLL